MRDDDILTEFIDVGMIFLFDIFNNSMNDSFFLV